MSSVALATALVVGTALGSNSASATTLYDNLSAGSSGTDAASSVGPLYDSFSTGSSALFFDSLNLLLNASSPGDGGTFTVSLLSDNSTSPGSLIGSSNPELDSSLSTSLGVVSLTPSILLAANSRYWIELSSTGSVNWSWSTDISGVGVAAEYYDSQRGVLTNVSGPYQMQVGGTSVSATPLPAALPLFATGLGAMGLLGWRKRRKAALAAA